MSDPTDQSVDEPDRPDAPKSEPEPGASEPEPEASESGSTDPDAGLDVDEEEDRLDDLAGESEKLKAAAEDDLTPGGQGRTFAEQGVQETVAERGDTDRPPADA